MKAICIILFFLVTFVAQSQVVELTGAIFIGNSQLLSYRASYEIDSKNRVTGYSVCDIGGASETKARISGAYNPRKKTLSFSEKSIINAKPAIPATDFCLMKVEGKFEKKNGKQIFTGTFSSKSANINIICDSGTIVLTTTKEVYEMAAKVANKIDKTNLPDTLNNNFISQLQQLKGVEKVKTVKPGSVSQYELDADSIQLDIFDDGIEDGDIITILKNNKVLISDFKTTNEVKTLLFPVDRDEKLVVFTIIAVTEGSLAKNTVKVVLSIGKRKELLIAPLKQGERFQIKLTR